MSTKPIYRLPEIDEPHEWGCDGGCDLVKPVLFKHVYKQVWNPEGVLVEQLAEHYYTCSQGHLVSVWDSNTGDDVELPEEHYQEQVNRYGYDQQDIEDARAMFKEQKEKLCEELGLKPSDTKASFTIQLADGKDLIFTEDYLNEVEALLNSRTLNSLSVS